MKSQAGLSQFNFWNMYQVGKYMILTCCNKNKLTSSSASGAVSVSSPPSRSGDGRLSFDLSPDSGLSCNCEKQIMNILLKRQTMGAAFQSGLRICARSFQPEVDMDNLPCSAMLANIQKKLLHLKRDGGVAMMFWLDR